MSSEPSSNASPAHSLYSSSGARSHSGGETSGPSLRLPASAGQARLDDLRTVSEALLEIQRLEKQHAELTLRNHEIAVPESLVRHREFPLDLTGRLGTYKKGIDELPRLQGEMNELEAEMRALLRKIGRDLPLDLVENLRIDAGAQATLRKLALEMTAISEAKLRAFRALAEREARRQILVEEREARGRCATPKRSSGRRSERSVSCTSRGVFRLCPPKFIASKSSPRRSYPRSGWATCRSTRRRVFRCPTGRPSSASRDSARTSRRARSASPSVLTN